MDVRHDHTELHRCHFFGHALTGDREAGAPTTCYRKLAKGDGGSVAEEMDADLIQLVKLTPPKGLPPLRVYAKTGYYASPE
jgi:hypothetical protein